MIRSGSSDGVIVPNPESGTGDHASTVRSYAADYGYAVRETTREGHAVDLARAAAEAGAAVVAAAGGDGTLNELVRGIQAAEALDSLTVGVLIGNGRRFPPGGSEQASMEDGNFDVTLVRATGSVGLLRTAAVERLVTQATPWTTRDTVSAVDITVTDDEPVVFSLDGEIIRRRQLSLRILPTALRLAAGDGYEPTPG